MTPEALRSLLFTLPTLQEWPDEPEELTAALDRAASDDPQSRSFHRAILLASQLARAERHLPRVIAQVRRERLVRADDWTTTWDGVGPDGGLMRVRVLRPELNSDPILNRLLSREAEALAEVVPGVRAAESEHAITAPLPGPALKRAQEGDEEDEGPLPNEVVTARLLGTALRDLVRWEQAGLGPAGPTLDDLRDVDDGVRLVCLTAGEWNGPRTLRQTAVALQRWLGAPGGRMGQLLSGLAAMPHTTAREASAAFRHELAADLASRRHDLFQRHRANASADRRVRLHAALGAMLRACPPPHGRGAIGIDLEGQITALRSDEKGIFWGPASEERPVWRPASGFEPREARRLLRARAASPANPRLQEEVGGSQTVTEAVCRWISAAMRLRTLRLLLVTDTGQPWTFPT